MTKTSFWDSKIQPEKLGGFVYGLLDPTTNQIFYIGLGGGKGGQGNNRPDGHLQEAEKAIKAGHPLSTKQAVIKKIWDERKEPKLIIIRKKLSPQDAKQVEGALIDTFRYLDSIQLTNKLTNEVRGSGVDEHGIVTENKLIELYADPIQPSVEIRDVWLFNIKNARNEGRDFYESIRGDWRISEKSQTNGFAVGLVDGISRVVIKIEAWNKGLKDKAKASFTGTNADRCSIGKQLFEKDFSNIIKDIGRWQWGNPISVDILPNKVKYKYGVKKITEKFI